ncbi:MAG: hypothetical protein D6718_00515 [Acidobacteria bacterium]|nr:MAG: hypothetical protein D6718_00515 [Acidobacteriota bacterium]
MREREQHGDAGRGGASGRAWRWAYLVVAALLWMQALFGAEGLIRQIQRRAYLVRLQRVVAEEEAANRRLRAEVEALAHDDLAIESAVRTELDYQRPGELVLIVDDPDPLDR